MRNSVSGSIIQWRPGKNNLVYSVEIQTDFSGRCQALAETVRAYSRALGSIHYLGTLVDPTIQS